MVFGDTEQLRDVFTWSLVEDAQRDNGPLNFAELCYAGAQPQLFHGLGHQLVRKSDVTVRELDSVDCVVGTRSKMSPPVIARDVTNDGREHRFGISHLPQLTGSDQIDEGAECFLNTIDRIFGRQSLVSRDGGKAASLGLGDMQQPIEHVVVQGSGHTGSESKVFCQLEITGRCCN